MELPLEPKKDSNTPDSVPSNEVSLLGTDSRFVGTVRFEGTLRVDGHITGDIFAPVGSGSVLIINDAAVVHGNIVSDSVLISGEVRGDVRALDRVEIFRKGLLAGNIHTGDIMIEGGAEFQGQCHMLRDGEEPPEPARDSGSGEDSLSGTDVPAIHPQSRQAG